jgi:O-antigen/teichoic acid export membrane protein
MTPLDSVVKVMKNTVALTSARVSAPLFSFVLVIFAARYLGVDDFGKFVLVQSYYNLFLGLCVNALATVLIREVAKNLSLVSKYLNAAVLLILILTLLSNVLLFILTLILQYDTDSRLAIYIAGGALFPASVTVMLESAFVAYEKAEYVTFATVSVGIIRVGISIFALLTGHGLLVLFAIFTASSLFGLFLNLFLFNVCITRLRWKPEFSCFKEFTRSWRTFAAENWIYNIYHRLDVIFLSILQGTFAVGMYGAAHKLLHPGSVVSSGFTKAIFPQLARLSNSSQEGFYSVTQGVIKYMFIIVLPVVMVVYMLSKQLIILIYGSKYIDAFPILNILIWVLIPLFLNSFLSHALFAQGKQKTALKIGIFNLSLYVPLCIGFISYWGAKGASVALLLALGVSSFVYLLSGSPFREAVRVCIVIARTAAAVLFFAVFVYLARDIALVPVLFIALAFYLILLRVFRVVSSNDLRLIREIAHSAFRRIGSIMARI